MCKSLHESTDNNSNTINTIPTVSLPDNTPVCQNCDAYTFLLSEGIGSLEQSFDTQLRNVTQMSPVKSNSKETNANNESDILIESLQDTIHILKKELVNKENTINNLSIILKKITSNTYNVSPSNKEFGNELILDNNTDHINSKNEIIHELLDIDFEHLQRRTSTYLISRPINQSKQLAMTNAAMGLMLPKGIKLLNLTFKTKN